MRHDVVFLLNYIAPNAIIHLQIFLLQKPIEFKAEVRNYEQAKGCIRYQLILAVAFISNVIFF